MGEDRLRCVLLADFNVGTLAGYLQNSDAAPELEVPAVPYGQVAQLALDGSHEVWEDDPEAALVWTRPEAQCPAFGRLLAGHDLDSADLAADVDGFVDLVRQVGQRVGTVLVASWALPPSRRVYQTMAMRGGGGTDRALLEMNVRLANGLDDVPGCVVLNGQRWVAAHGDDAFSPKLWYMSKTPFSHGVLKEAATSVKAALRTLHGGARKLIVLDLDNTLWGGVVGEVGWEQLKLGGHDPVGEAFEDFQVALKSLVRRGVILGIVSRNEESVALEAIRRHPEMVLGPDDFAGWRIGWGDKARYVEQLVEEINLGLDSVVFIDDDPFQRARVREALPGVLVPEWPEDPTRYAAALLEMSCFDSAGVSEEDRARARMYAARRERVERRESYSSLEEWLSSLDTRVAVEPLDEANLQRAVQLLNKTNQMNMATRRMGEAEYLEFAESEGAFVRAFRVVDRFGELGLTGLLGVSTHGDEARIEDFLLSCRAMGRKIEETMAAVAVELARAAGCDRITARYRRTERNAPCLEFWRESGFDVVESSDASALFEWDVHRDYPVPEQVQVESPGRADGVAAAGSPLAGGG